MATNTSTSPTTIFVSMGMFILDEIHFPRDSHTAAQYSVIGGGGTYGALGARVITTSRQSRSIGWVVDKGSDFPCDVEKYLNSWETGVVWREDKSRLTTRGWNMYGDNDFREFKYLTPKLRIEVCDVLDHPSLLSSQSYHLICSPQRCQQILGLLSQHRETAPVICWEVVPDLCTPENLSQCLDNLQYIQIFTPNAEEASRFFGMSELQSKAELEALASKFLPYLTSGCAYGNGIVLRCGSLGCYTLTTTGLAKWFQAYHTDPVGVVDPTGGGNTFIGAFTTAFVLSKGDWEVASICGNIGAAVAIEQIGMPQYDNDHWNGASLEQRLERYIGLSGTVLSKLGL